MSDNAGVVEDGMSGERETREIGGAYEIMLVDVIRELRSTMEAVRSQLASMENTVSGCEARNLPSGLWGRSVVPTWLLLGLFMLSATLGGINAWSLVAKGVSMAVPVIAGTETGSQP